MKTIKILCTLLCTLLTVLPATAQNTDGNKNKAIIEATDGQHELNTDDIQSIRFNGGKITFVQPSGDTTFDRTLRSLSFQRPNPGTLRLTASTTIGTESNSGSKRAQAIDGEGNLRATWGSSDVVYVYASASATAHIGTLRPATTGSNSATLTGNINGDGLTDGQTLYFSTKPRSFDLTQQDGTVESLFYFTATGTLTIDGANASISNLAFSRPIAIVKFTLKDKDDNKAISTKPLTVFDGTRTYTVTPASATSTLFVGIPAISSQPLNLKAKVGNDTYVYEKTSATFAANKYYAISVKMTSMLKTPLTLEFYSEADSAAQIFVCNKKFSDHNSIYYSDNGGERIAIPANSKEYTISFSNGVHIVQFWGNNACYSTVNGSSYINVNRDCKVYGNIMSLVSSDNFATTTTLTANYAFCNLFRPNNDNYQLIYIDPNKPLLLPATTLTENCYSNMFYDCTYLTTAPELPATTLVKSCYSNMFYGCTNLSAAPELPATTLVQSCYSQMFYGCTGLTTAPELPATTLVQSCYSQMFYGCTRLNSVTCLATDKDISASSYTSNWLSGVPATGTFYKATSMTSWGEGASGIPTGWNAQSYVVETPLTFEAMTAGATVTFTSSMDTPPIIEYSTDGSTWNTYTTAITLDNAGDKVMFRGDNAAYATSSSAYSQFTCSDDCYVYGNIMSLVSKENYTKNKTLTADYAFCGLFKDNGHLHHQATTRLLLPATMLSAHCYADMFSGCTSLTVAPTLPATTLANACYERMFSDCTGLTTAPELPANKLAAGCYQHMFDGCTQLNSVTCLAADHSAADCTNGWLNGVAATGTFAQFAGTIWSDGANGIPIGWTAQENLLATPLTFEAKTAGATVTFNIAEGVTNPVEYSTDGTWNTYTSGTVITLENIGDRVMFRGDNATYGPSHDSQFTCSADCYVYGNIMSLVSKDNFATSTVLTKDYTFSRLFKDNAHIWNHASRNLLLPATVLTEYCYGYMFSGCSNLTVAPELPAKTLGGNCYQNMFSGCTSLTVAPELPATDLKMYCYSAMFKGCTSLTTAPVLPATYLRLYCYESMFNGCTSLNSVTCLATNITQSNCTKNWLNNVAATGTFITPSGTNWASKTNTASNVQGIPDGWTRKNPDGSDYVAP